MFRRFVVSIVALSAASGLSAAPPTSFSQLRLRAATALPGARASLDEVLTDYPSARFRSVQARLVRSVYADDEGQSNKVPWMHRGGVVLVICGEINTKNRMGGYTGWEPFAYQPAQTDIVTIYDFSEPRKPTQENLARKPKLRISGGNGYDNESVGLLCGSEAEQIDPADLSAGLAFR
jgi:hypothetical protein